MKFVFIIVLGGLLAVLWVQNSTIQQQKLLIRQMTHNPACMVDDTSILKR